MKCFYYKWVSKKTGKVIMANFGWAESFDAIKENANPRTISCIEIDVNEFHELRSKGF